MSAVLGTLQKLIKLFEGRKIPYMIIGGQAVLIHGEPRLTKDIDVTLGMDITEMPLIVKVVKKSGLRVLPKSTKVFVKQTMVLPVSDTQSGLRIDLIFSHTTYERGAIQRAIVVKINGQEVRFASVEDTIIHKIFAGRPRDIEDVQSILKKQSAYDKKYIRHWLKEFSKVTSRDLVSEYNDILKGLKV